MTTTSEKDVSKKSAEMKTNSNVTKKEEKKEEFKPIICYGNDGNKFEQWEGEDADDFYERVRAFYN